ncbi:hypothetical protein G114_10695 [Aeromonas diversa CDC 2478-85]|uniref:Uncharacterized protein n=1 Tax=Aeromonas diversa CDC 2478-85 TaxID=1268237 RepID=N9V9B5_9GAMM|nr:hypothetical protein G114_10695 [Aeromonas diversa CDC 2478-85]
MVRLPSLTLKVLPAAAQPHSPQPTQLDLLLLIVLIPPLRRRLPPRAARPATGDPFAGRAGSTASRLA